MPWISRPRKPPSRLRQGLRRWRYDHSQGVVSFWIAVAVIAVAVLAAATVLMT